MTKWYNLPSEYSLLADATRTLNDALLLDLTIKTTAVVDKPITLLIDKDIIGKESFLIMRDSERIVARWNGVDGYDTPGPTTISDDGVYYHGCVNFK